VRVLVTGGTGFIGGFLVDRLLAEGFPTRVLARPSSRADKIQNAGAEVIMGDLAGQDSVDRAVQGMECVFHCGAQVGSHGTREEFFQSNVRGTELILEASVRAGVQQVVYLSSLGVYGPPLNSHPITEETPFDPKPEKRGHYSHTKIIAERLAVRLAKQHGLPLVILRPGFVYGGASRPPAGLFAFQRGNRATVIGRKDCILPLNYVENLVDAMLLAVEVPSVETKQFNILDDDHLTQEQYSRIRRKIEGTRIHFLPGWPFRVASPLVEIAGHILPHERLKTFSRHQLDRTIQMVRYDTTRIRKELGWQPRVGLEQGLRMTFGVQN
jgi:2-alkyl-3-oxoalkanoate reductase